MRLIKMFESFNIENDINDILYEIEDLGFRVDKSISKDEISIFITNEKEEKGNTHDWMTYPMTVEFSVLRYNIEHLISFLKDNDWELDSCYNIIQLNPAKIDISKLKDNDLVGRLEFRFNN